MGFFPSPAAEIFVAAVLSWICLTLNSAARNRKTAPSDRVMLDLGLGLAAVMAAVFWLSALMGALF